MERGDPFRRDDAAELETLYGLLVIKNGHLVAERYFDNGSVKQKALLQFASKSYVSALVGIALDQGCLSSMDQKMLEFFPESAARIMDLKSYAQKHLFSPMAVEVGDFIKSLPNE